MKASSEFAAPLAFLREGIARAELLPPAYARYQPLLADGICFFLKRLPAARLRKIVSAQAALPSAASVSERLVTLCHFAPTLHKLAQVLARNRRLDVRFRRWLQQLESLEPRTSAAEFARLLEREFAGWKKAGITLGPQALAEGSVAVVMPFDLRDGKRDPHRPRAGVFKLLKPGIEDLLAEDLAIWGKLGEFLDEDCERYRLPHLDYAETFELVRDLLAHEVRLDEEQKHLAEASAEYTSMRSVAIPALLPFGSRRLTAMERLEGATLTEQLGKGDFSCRKLGPVIAQALVARPLFSGRPAALFHADPHAGNLFPTTGGRLGILDWSLAGRLQKGERVELVQILLASLRLDVSGLERAIQALADNSARPAALRRAVEEATRELRWGGRPGVSWLTRLLDALATEAGARFKGGLLLFRKSLLTLEGVLADVSGRDEGAADALLDQALLTGLMEHLAVEWPQRWRTPADSRAFQTHLSTQDLLSLWYSAPEVWARYWVGAWRDLLAAGPRQQ